MSEQSRKRLVAHQIADDFSGGWVSPVIPAGGSIAITFPDQTGEFDFHCKIHPAMHGKVVVQ
ncbi:MAG: cupredoxin domain-containing protein [Bryobacteraceae bacterium]